LKLQFNYQIPSKFIELKTLKGIGDYNANAILCFGFNQRRALLDTNFIRLYKRLFNIKPKTKTPKTDKYLWGKSEELLPEKNFIQFNYAILDFANKICKNKNPKCEICILNDICYSLKK